SLGKRGELKAGVEAERRAARSSLKCEVNADTNIVFLLADSLCNENESERQYADEQVAQAQRRLAVADNQRSALGDQVYFRIAAANLVPKIRRVRCPSETIPQRAPDFTVAVQLQSLL